MKIYPSVLTGNEDLAQKQLNLIQHFKDCKVVQLDVLDGIFADNLTLSPVDFVQLDFGKVKADFHLMVEEPLDFVYELKDVKHRIPIRAVIGQVEKMSHQSYFLEEVKKEEWLPGLSLNLHTPLEAVDQSSWSQVKLVQLMAVEAGYQGQIFKPITLEKIEELVALRLDRQLKFEIVVDGGIKPAMIEELGILGAEAVVVGSAIWQAGRDHQIIQTYQQLHH